MGKFCIDLDKKINLLWLNLRANVNLSMLSLGFIQ